MHNTTTPLYKKSTSHFELNKLRCTYRQAEKWVAGCYYQQKVKISWSMKVYGFLSNDDKVVHLKLLSERTFSLNFGILHQS